MPKHMWEKNAVDTAAYAIGIYQLQTYMHNMNQAMMQHCFKKIHEVFYSFIWIDTLFPLRNLTNGLAKEDSNLWFVYLNIQHIMSSYIKIYIHVFNII